MKNQFHAAHKARIAIGSPLAEVASAQVAFGLINPITLELAAYINSSGVLVLANGQTLQSTLTLNDATTPSISLAAGSTNTGTITINGKTSGKVILTTADATGQTITIKPAAQTSGAVTLTTPDFAGVNDTFAFITKAQTFSNKTFVAPVLGVATGTSLAVTGLLSSSSPSAGIGYATGAGTAATQSTNKSTTVTNAASAPSASGTITMNNAALAAATIVSFTFTNSAIGATDTLILNHVSGGTVGSYTLNAQCAAGSATINLRNNTAGSLSEAVVIQYALIKGVAA